MKYKRFRKGIFCVPYKLEPLRYLILHRKLHWKGWEFTKGKRKFFEKAKDACKREIREETDLKIKEIKDFSIEGKFVYDKKSQQEWKAKGFKYKLFACEVKKGVVKVSKKEHDRYKWCTYEQAFRLLRWHNQKRSLKIVNEFIKQSFKRQKK